MKFDVDVQQLREITYETHMKGSSRCGCMKIWRNLVDVHVMVQASKTSMVCLQKALGEKQQSGGGEESEVVTEVDAWDKAVRALQSGLTPQQVPVTPVALTLIFPRS